jgi:hypothetical protein
MRHAVPRETRTPQFSPATFVRQLAELFNTSTSGLDGVTQAQLAFLLDF